MAMGTRRQRDKQQDLWIPSSAIAETPRHVFYDRLQTILEQHTFDRKVEQLCRRYYKEPYGRPTVTPGVYFRMLLIGYLEGLDSERGIAWRVADSLSLRKFLGYGLMEETSDHSTELVYYEEHALETLTVCDTYGIPSLCQHLLGGWPCRMWSANPERAEHRHS